MIGRLNYRPRNTRITRICLNEEDLSATQKRTQDG